MRDTKKWTSSLNLSSTIVTVLYLPTAAIGYWVYAQALDGKQDILAAVRITGNAGVIVADICATVVILHLLSVTPVFVNPIFLAVIPLIQTHSLIYSD